MRAHSSAEVRVSTRRSPTPEPKLTIVRPNAPLPPPDLGRMLSPDDIIALLPVQRNGKRPSRYTVLTTFFPEGKRKVGKSVYWWEAEVMAHLAGNFADGRTA